MHIFKKNFNRRSVGLSGSTFKVGLYRTRPRTRFAALV